MAIRFWSHTGGQREPVVYTFVIIFVFSANRCISINQIRIPRRQSYADAIPYSIQTFFRWVRNQSYIWTTSISIVTYQPRTRCESAVVHHVRHRDNGLPVQAKTHLKTNLREREHLRTENQHHGYSQTPATTTRPSMSNK